MTTNPTKEDSSTSVQPDQPTTIPFKILYHKHKPCPDCLTKNAFLDSWNRLVCRDCGLIRDPVRSEFLGSTPLQIAIDELCLICSRLVHPLASDDLLAEYAKGRKAWLQELCFWSDDKDDVEKYRVRFNMLTRLVQQRIIIQQLLKKTTANVDIDPK